MTACEDAGEVNCSKGIWTMPHLLFVCTGNICRSPFAEHYAREVASRAGMTDWSFGSAGVGALVGRPMDPAMAAELTALGGDPSGFRAQALNRQAAEGADLIVAMETTQRSFVLDDFPGLVRRTFTLGQLAGLVGEQPAQLHGTELLGRIGALRSRARTEDDIADPFRRGQHVAHAVAERIADLLDGLVPRLAG